MRREDGAPGCLGGWDAVRAHSPWFRAQPAGRRSTEEKATDADCLEKPMEDPPWRVCATTEPRRSGCRVAADQADRIATPDASRRSIARLPDVKKGVIERNDGLMADTIDVADWFSPCVSRHLEA